MNEILYLFVLFYGIKHPIVTSPEYFAEQLIDDIQSKNEGKCPDRWQIVDKYLNSNL